MVTKKTPKPKLTQKIKWKKKVVGNNPFFQKTENRAFCSKVIFALFVFFFFLQKSIFAVFLPFFSEIPQNTFEKNKKKEKNDIYI